MMLAGVGLFLSAMAPQNSVWLALGMFCVAAAGLYGFFVSFWALPNSFLSGTVAAAAIGLINSVGNLGGLAGSSVVGQLTESTTASYSGGVLYLAASALLASIFILQVRTNTKSAELALQAANSAAQSDVQPWEEQIP
jgi:hypothetical protein